MTLSRRWYLAASVLLVAVLCVASSAYAADDSAAAAERASDIFRWINFAIVIGLLIWVFGKLLPATFRKNAESISSAITTATAAKQAAERQMQEAERKLSHLDNEVKSLKATAEKESAAEAERIRAMAQTEARKIAVAADAEIEAAERSARLELKALAASLAVDGAETLLAKQLNDDAQESLLNAFVTSLEGSPN
jgi:F-type H+-transporting ATPase subunit b